jgi:hypothetical protein
VQVGLNIKGSDVTTEEGKALLQKGIDQGNITSLSDDVGNTTYHFALVNLNGTDAVSAIQQQASEIVILQQQQAPT